MGHAALAGEEVSASQPLPASTLPVRAISLSANPAIIQITNDCISQGVNIRLKTLQILLSFITNFPTVLDRLLKNVRPFVLFPLP